MTPRIVYYLVYAEKRCSGAAKDLKGNPDPFSGSRWAGMDPWGTWGKDDSMFAYVCLP